VSTLAYLLAPRRDIPRDADDAWLGPAGTVIVLAIGPEAVHAFRIAHR